MNNLSELTGYEFEPTTFSYSERDAILYALGVGAASDPRDMQELRFVYENHPDGFQVLPTFAVTFGYQTMWQILAVPGLDFNPMMLLHGEQVLELYSSLPPAAVLTNRGTISAVYDKGKGALFLLDVTSEDAGGTPLAYNQYALFVRGLGGWNGERGPAGSAGELPARAPDAVYEERIPEDQALLYRLSGDRNPLHVDPRMAAIAGFDRPILHGLCTFGFAARAVLETYAEYDITRFQKIGMRFARHVFPGETLRTEMWEENERQIRFQSRVVERDEVVLLNATFNLNKE